VTSGKAQGKDRDYQVLARDIFRVLSEQQSLFPYEGDGIDVAFDMGGTIWTLDVALKDHEGKTVVAECRRWRGKKIKQGHIAEFAYKVELLRKHSNASVAGLYFTKSKYQIGAIKAAAWAGIEVAICDEGQPLTQFVVSYQLYDAEREKRLQKVLGCFTESQDVADSVRLTVTRADGTIEENGK